MENEIEKYYKEYEKRLKNAKDKKDIPKLLYLQTLLILSMLKKLS